jgi:hypothetical protein
VAFSKACDGIISGPFDDDLQLAPTSVACSTGYLGLAMLLLLVPITGAAQA